MVLFQRLVLIIGYESKCKTWGTTDFSLFLAFIIPLLGYSILTHTHLISVDSAVRKNLQAPLAPQLTPRQVVRQIQRDYSMLRSGNSSWVLWLGTSRPKHWLWHAMAMGCNGSKCNSQLGYRFCSSLGDQTIHFWRLQRWSRFATKASIGCDGGRTLSDSVSATWRKFHSSTSLACQVYQQKGKNI